MSYYTTSGYYEECGDNSFNIGDFKAAERSYRAAQNAISPESADFNARFKHLQNKLIKTIEKRGVK